MNTDEKFELAVNFIKSLPPKGEFTPSNDMKLSFYSLYKQGTIGPCTTSQPGIWSLVERTKWCVHNL